MPKLRKPLHLLAIPQNPQAEKPHQELRNPAVKGRRRQSHAEPSRKPDAQIQRPNEAAHHAAISLKRGRMNTVVSAAHRPRVRPRKECLTCVMAALKRVMKIMIVIHPMGVLLSPVAEVIKPGQKVPQIIIVNSPRLNISAHAKASHAAILYHRSEAGSHI